ncbi:MAG: putative sporulation protein YtxC [Clostridia bacterium]|nr:putative sporulation protein YtxC [Clostridia bacterium]
MLRSFCIKTNNKSILEFLKCEFENSNLQDLYISTNSFKNFKNIILHYKYSNNLNLFYTLIAETMTKVIVEFYENNMTKKILISNYFYFSKNEQESIYNNCLELLEENNDGKSFRQHVAFTAFYDYIKENKYMVIDGFINFRLKKYLKSLDEIVDLAVDRYVLEKEYNEFISLLRLYINSKEIIEPVVHLIYQEQESILLNEHKQILDTTSDVFDIKYLSDIKFTSNDYALNALLNLLPGKLYVHLIDGVEDEFINTLKLIFENRICICRECAICNIYKLQQYNRHKVKTE